MRLPRKSSLIVQILYLLVAAVPAVSVSYYFAIALPRDNAARLRLDQDRMKAAEAEKSFKAVSADMERQRVESEQQRLETDRTYNATMRDACFKDADDHYWAYVKLNGSSTGPGTYSASHTVWDYADNMKKAELDECYRRYPVAPSR
jgi:hypothetical protein